jgi:8-oxo-dGTP diphosphatase
VTPGDAVTGGPDAPGLDGLRIRRAVRAVVLDPSDRVLLVCFEFPTRTVWATPGGGQEPGEDDEATLRRELDEELGLREVEIGPHVWTRVHVIPFLDGSWDGQRDHVYLVRTPPFIPHPTLTWEQLRAERVHELRWWTLAEVAAAGRDGVWFSPRALPDLLADLVVHGPPAVPVDVGV